MALIDEFTRECLAIRVAFRINSLGAIETLADVMLIRAFRNISVRTTARIPLINKMVVLEISVPTIAIKFSRSGSSPASPTNSIKGS
jgi:hypothetical protein